MRRMLIGATLIALLAGACGSSSKKAAAAPETRSVNVDAKTDKFIGGFLAYFPSQVKVRPGDTVVFKEIWTGEPHTVTAGTLVQKGLAAAKAAGPNSNGPPPAEFASLPTLLPQGPGDMHHNAGQPCFLDTGAPPTDQQGTACAKAAQPDFNGKQTYYNSGFLPKDATFTMKLAPDIAPGAYQYYCALHADMIGTIQVVGKSDAIPSQAEVDTQAKTELDDVVNKLTPALQQVQQGQGIPFPGSVNFAGYGTDSVQNALINQFFPGVIKAKVGQKVSWTVVGPHTISFNPPADAQEFIATGPDGVFHLNEKALAPAGSLKAPSPPPSGGGPNGGAPPPGPPVPTAFSGGSYNGVGFASSGLMVSFPGSPSFVAYSVTFTKPGTYNYVCILHPGQAGQVVVS